MKRAPGPPKAPARRYSPVDAVAVVPHHCTPARAHSLLGQTPYFAPLAAAELADAARSFHQLNYPEGAVIHRVGDPANRLSIVVAGQVRLVRPTVDGQDVLLAILGEGEHFGSLLELGDARYRDEASAHTDCCILATSADEFRALLQRYPRVTLAVLDLVGNRLRDAQATIEQLSAYPVAGRIAATVLGLAERLGRPDGDLILIDTRLSRQDLADMTGATVETVSRVLSGFRRDGLIDSGRQWIAVRDAAGLARIVEHGRG